MRCPVATGEEEEARFEEGRVERRAERAAAGLDSSSPAFDAGEEEEEEESIEEDYATLMERSWPRNTEGLFQNRCHRVLSQGGSPPLKRTHRTPVASSFERG